jgi:hypothetical protein
VFALCTTVGLRGHELTEASNVTHQARELGAAVRFGYSRSTMEKTLVLDAAFGPSRDQTLLLTHHPEESHDEYGRARLNVRTLILSLKGNKATFREERPVPLRRAWYSPTSGVAYCASVDSNKLFKWQGGVWSEEVFTDKPVPFVRYLFGIPGEKPEDDQLFLAVSKALFIRSQGLWKRHKLAYEAPFQIHGRLPTDVYIGSIPPVRWDGKKLTEFEAPDDGGEILHALWVASDDRLIGGTQTLYRSTSDGGWEDLGLPQAHYGNLVEFAGVLYSPTDRGMVQVQPTGPAPVAGPAVDLNRAVDVGDGLIGIGAVSVVFDGKAWKTIELPACEVGRRPR